MLTRRKFIKALGLLGLVPFIPKLVKENLPIEEPYVIRPDPNEGGGKFGKVGYVSWKPYQRSVILNEGWMTRVSKAGALNETN